MKELEKFRDLFEQDFTESFRYNSEGKSDSREIDELLNFLYTKGFTACDFGIDYSVDFVFEKDDARLTISVYPDHTGYEEDTIWVYCEIK